MSEWTKNMGESEGTDYIPQSPTLDRLQNILFATRLHVHDLLKEVEREKEQAEHDEKEYRDAHPLDEEWDEETDDDWDMLHDGYRAGIIFLNVVAEKYGTTASLRQLTDEYRSWVLKNDPAYDSYDVAAECVLTAAKIFLLTLSPQDREELMRDVIAHEKKQGEECTIDIEYVENFIQEYVSWRALLTRN